jgi:hypothetical protein
MMETGPPLKTLNPTKAETAHKKLLPIIWQQEKERRDETKDNRMFSRPMLHFSNGVLRPAGLHGHVEAK